MFSFLLWVIRFQILIVDFTTFIRNVRNSTSHTLNTYMSGSEISLSFTFAILSIASQLKALVHSKNCLDINHDSLCYYV